MKAYITVVLACCCFSVSAQTKTSKKKASTQQTRTTKSTNQKKTEPVNVRDRINQRLKDSATSATTATATTTVINGITVTTPAAAKASTTNKAATITNTTVTANNVIATDNAETNRSSTTVGGNSVTNTNSTIQGRPIPGTIPVIATNAADVGGKPITQEQTRSTATDVNRIQMNAINGNQVASQAQNPNNTTKDLNSVGSESYWGTNQVGENMWTPPNNVIAGFTNDYPAIRGATWTRDNTMKTFSARYKTGDLWSTSIYNNTGVQMETRIEMPLIGTLPQPLTTFKSKQSALVDFNRISRIVRPGREELFEVRLSTGRIAYINSRGEEVHLQ
jgi:hypothetical protein